MGRRAEHVVASPPPALLLLLAVPNNNINPAAGVAGLIGAELEIDPGVAVGPIAGVGPGLNLAVIVPVNGEAVLVPGNNAGIELEPERVAASPLLLSLYGAPGF